MSQGIHHITAIAGNPRENHRFYTQVLGMRMVKKTVNFDDPSVYHLYYGDESGAPGSILTFFPWQHLQKGEPDRGQVVAVSFSIPTGSRNFWLTHLKEQKVDVEAPFERFGKEVIGLQDPDGLHLELVLDPAADEVEGWSGGALPKEHTVRRLHGATLTEESYGSTGRLLEDDLGFEFTDRFDDRYRYTSGARFGSVIEIIDQFEPEGRPGKGTVHHIAFRCKDDEAQQLLRKKLIDKGYYLTEVKDRQYFRSVYFHEPGGVLFEIATDPPGFTLDESLESLGTSLKLPEWLEGRRNQIQAQLPSLTDNISTS